MSAGTSSFIALTSSRMVTLCWDSGARHTCHLEGPGQTFRASRVYLWVGWCLGCHRQYVTPASSQLLISVPDPPILELQGQGNPSSQTRELRQEEGRLGLQQPWAPFMPVGACPREPLPLLRARQPREL